MTASFKDSQEAAFRRLVRDCIRRGPFSLAERDVTLAMVNLWFHHRNGPKGYIHPSRESIAVKVGVSVKTVSRALAMLRDLGVLEVVSNLKGGKATATRYRVNVWELCAFCGAEWLDRFGVNVSVNDSEMSRYPQAKMSHCLNDVRGVVVPFVRRAS